MNGAIIGFGNIAQAHIEAYETVWGMQILFIVDSSQMNIDYVKKTYPHINCYSSIEDLFADQSVDFIDICTPPNTHFYYIKSGLRAGCHVLCEKPFLIDIVNYPEILSLMGISKRQVYPLHNYKFAQAVKWMKEHVVSNEFGDFKYGHFRTIRSTHAQGASHWKRDWRRIPEISGGGILFDHGPHNIYLSCFLLQSLPIAVSCITGLLRRDSDYLNTEDTALITLYFENEVKVFIELSWAGSCRDTHYSLVGSKRCLFVENDKLHISKNGVFETTSIDLEFDDPLHKNWFREMFNDFLNLIENPIRQNLLFQEAFYTTMIIQKAYESASKNGEIIPVTQYNCSDY